jgi:hypothetical protein
MNGEPVAADREKTLRLELKRSVALGILEGASGTFLLLVAVQHLQTGAVAKALLVAGVPIGLLLSPLATALVRHRGWTAARGLSVFGWTAAAGFVLAAAGSPGVYLAGSLLGLLALALGIPLVTQIYHDNFPARARGHLFARVMMLRVGVTALFAWVAGVGLDRSFEYYRLLLLVFASAAGLSAWWGGRFPSGRLAGGTSANPLRSLRHLRHDAAFRWILVGWMFMGIGNLVMLPLRIEYLGDPRYGLDYSPLLITVCVTVVPAVVQLAFALPFGWLFDRMNFFLLRLVLNLLIAGWIACFFLGPGLGGYLAGGVLLGLSLAGGSVTWSLWVTKIAPPGLVAEYMGVHTFLTGLRAGVAPFLAFYLATFVPMGRLAGVCIALILLGSLVFVPEARTLRVRRPALPVEPKPGGITE